jgi:LacI family transcriptional regulator
MRQPKPKSNARSPSRSRGASTPRVAVLVDTSTSWGRRIHLGIHNYDRKHGGWHLFVEARGLEERLRVPPGWECDGVIARVGSVEMAEELRALRIPVVNVSGIDLPGVEFPRVVNDLRASASSAATHFLERGFRHFAYFSLLGLGYIATHQQAFAETVTARGGDFASFATKPMAGAEPDWNLDLATLGKWLKSLPKPVAVLTWNPSSAREVIYAAQVAGLLVPEEVAVLSGSDDTLLCELLPVPVSGILVAAEQVGHQAARLLDRLMQGKPAPGHAELIAPVGIVTRQSTDTLAIRNPIVVKALNFIRRNPAQPMPVNLLARHAGVSRRVLERQFMELLGRAPATEVRRVRLEHAKNLLAETDLPIPEVAEAAGFSSPEYLAYALRKHYGIAPLNYRKSIRSR